MLGTIGTSQSLFLKTYLGHFQRSKFFWKNFISTIEVILNTHLILTLTTLTLSKIRPREILEIFSGATRQLRFIV